MYNKNLKISIKFPICYCVILIALVCFLQIKAEASEINKPKISFTFDDGQINDYGNYKLEIWNEMILSTLNTNSIKSILFSMGHNKTNEKGKYVLSSWNNAGQFIANHTYSHHNYNSKNISFEYFKQDFLKNDSLINKYSNYLPFFRFPYLKEGNTKEKIDSIRIFLKEKGYRNGNVSIDASDWYIDSRLVKRLKENPNADVSDYKNYYIQHLFNRAKFYDSLALKLTNRQISHVILLHHNLSAALFLKDLIEYFKNNGWEIVDANNAYSDSIYNEIPNTIPAGESIIWSLAKQSGIFESILRYPPEDAEYEKLLMDKLGL